MTGAIEALEIVFGPPADERCDHSSKRRTGPSEWRCDCGAKWTVISWAEYDRLCDMARAADRYSKAMRTSRSARHFALTGEVK